MGHFLWLAFSRVLFEHFLAIYHPQCGAVRHYFIIFQFENLSTYKINKLLHGWFVCPIFLHSLRGVAELTRLFAPLATREEKSSALTNHEVTSISTATKFWTWLSHVLLEKRKHWKKRLVPIPWTLKRKWKLAYLLIAHSLL